MPRRPRRQCPSHRRSCWWVAPWPDWESGSASAKAQNRPVVERRGPKAAPRSSPSRRLQGLRAVRGGECHGMSCVRRPPPPPHVLARSRAPVGHGRAAAVWLLAVRQPTRPRAVGRVLRFGNASGGPPTVRWARRRPDPIRTTARPQDDQTRPGLGRRIGSREARREWPRAGSEPPVIPGSIRSVITRSQVCPSNRFSPLGPSAAIPDSYPKYSRSAWTESRTPGSSSMSKTRGAMVSGTGGPSAKAMPGGWSLTGGAESSARRVRVARASTGSRTQRLRTVQGPRPR